MFTDICYVANGTTDNIDRTTEIEIYDVKTRTAKYLSTDDLADIILTILLSYAIPAS